ncbi:RNA polymerase sigma factor [Psychrosphaera sp. 1_MG-2023]|uniref:RNA polymerase sigma factor n=1 Tax=Psychrosphaera algicola TaxID=3023714 RepID=A0ABT5FDH6_9GAMM|nr:MULTISPECIES: RNA polymerase sigma factor [unclassified Psychrosphaera]MDC2888680.1 RNA polymerase sigma factor [Psychrosphaera sp. G1-22]MDO6721119.1 RNA polymerase sigma factor [Psychrosphaera sp. 1_MG-2023]
MSDKLDIATLLKEHAPLMARVATTYEADESLREDLIQDMSLAVWRALESFRGEANIKTFIARIAHNRAVDHVLKETRRHDRHNLDEPLESISSSVTSNKQDIEIDLMTALRKLAIGYRQVIALQLEGFNQAEIGIALGLTEANVAQRARRGRAQLEQILNRR